MNVYFESWKLFACEDIFARHIHVNSDAFSKNEVIFSFPLSSSVRAEFFFIKKLKTS